MKSFLYYIECYSTPLNTIGIGNIQMPTCNTVGTIDAAACTLHKKRKKCKSLKKYIEDKKCHQNTTDTMK